MNREDLDKLSRAEVINLAAERGIRHVDYDRDQVQLKSVILAKEPPEPHPREDEIPTAAAADIPPAVELEPETSETSEDEKPTEELTDAAGETEKTEDSDPAGEQPAEELTDAAGEPGEK